jgi:hypothetical protein
MSLTATIKCATCRRQFNGLAAINAHRAGEPGKRYCMDVHQLAAAGWHVCKRFVWSRPERLAVAA